MHSLQPSCRQFIALSSLGLATLPFIHCNGGKKNHPNVLLILTDDQGWGDIASHGNPLLSTRTWTGY